MQELQIGQHRYIQSGYHLYRHSEQAADAASKAEWARGVLAENNPWLSPEHMQAEVTDHLLDLAMATLTQAEAVLAAYLHGPVLVRPERPLCALRGEETGHQQVRLVMQIVERRTLTQLASVEVVDVIRAQDEPDRSLEHRAVGAYQAEVQQKITTSPTFQQSPKGREWCIDCTLV